MYLSKVCLYSSAVNFRPTQIALVCCSLPNVINYLDSIVVLLQTEYVTFLESQPRTLPLLPLQMMLVKFSYKGAKPDVSANHLLPVSSLNTNW